MCFDLTNTATSEFLTTETPLRIRIWDRRLARSPKNEPNSLIHTRHRGIPHRPYTMQKARPPFVLGAMLPKPDDYSKKKKVQKDLRNFSSFFKKLSLDPPILLLLHGYKVACCLHFHLCSWSLSKLSQGKGRVTPWKSCQLT